MGNVLTAQARGPELESSAPMENPGVIIHACHLITGSARQGDHKGSLASQSIQIGELRV